MHTALTRTNALAAYTMSVLASLTFLCFLSMFFTVKVVVKNVQARLRDREGEEWPSGAAATLLSQNITNLMMQADLFLYLSAEYETPNNKLNQVRYVSTGAKSIYLQSWQDAQLDSGVHWAGHARAMICVVRFTS